MEDNKHKELICGKDVIEKINLNHKKTKFQQVLRATSLYSNTEQIFRTDNGGKITCLNGIRLFSMIWIIFGHTFNYLTDRTYFFLLSKAI